jgi:hypothetical protein
MKKILLGLILLLPAATSAQETYSVAVNANQQARVERERTRRNTTTCLRLNAGTGGVCTQAQACVAAAATGGASCNAAQAQAVNAEIIANTTAGRQQVFISKAALAFQDIQNQSSAEDRAAECAWWNNPATTRADKDIHCNKIQPPRGNNCELCQAP